MNSLVIFEDEGWKQGRILITGARAHSVHAAGSHDVGSEIRVSLFGGDKGIAKVVKFDTNVIELELVSSEPSLKLRPIDLIVGLSRPQTTKKVIQAAVMAGVRSLHLVHLESGQPSYLDSHILRPEDLRQEIAKSLEQICEGLYPEIQVYRAFLEEQQGLLAGASGKLRVVAHSGGSCSLESGTSGGASSVVIAVGSEGGWSEKELRRRDILGFERLGLGPRVVRVEVALLYLLGQTILYS